MKRVTILLTSLLLAFVLGCRDHNLEPHPEDVMAWRAGGPAFDQGEHIATDHSGNVYVAGYFTQSATFGSKSLTSPAGGVTIFIAKYSPTGDILWVQQPTATNSSSIGGMAVDASGNVYLTGSFRGRITFGTALLTSSGANDVFTFKFNPHGEVQWARNTGGPSSNSISGEIASGIAVDESGNVYVTGSFEGTGTFGSTSYGASGVNDTFLIKYTSNGDLQWARSLGFSPSLEVSTDLAVDKQGNAYITGYFQNFLNNFDVFITKYNSQGDHQWSQWAGLTSKDEAYGIAVDGDGNVFITGVFSGMITFGTTTLTSEGAGDIFLTKYDTNGTFQWAKRAGGNQPDGGNDIAVDPIGHVYLIGDFNGTATFGTTSFTSSGGTDVAIAKYTNQGDFQWAQKLGGPGADRGLSIVAGSNHKVLATGSFTNTALFGSTTLTSAGQPDIYVASFNQ
ncbi:SBBP repeat-containing protein [Telluribacter humicola]|uniref:SBBP repeat-containing protein n=1 Tax=Telluribacter humicola TaxID=1720261 RepID=UPI001A96DD0A|nr:SBBP repeat-containing protein [Telluribacter humicola]